MGEIHHARANGIFTRVGDAVAPDGQTGIGFTVINGTIVISITKDGVGFAAELQGDDIDIAGGMFADAVVKATCHDAPSLRSVQ